MIRFGSPSAAVLDDTLAAAATHKVTYGHVGSTLEPGAESYSRTIDLEPGTFESAVRGLRAWACHDGIGASVHPPGVAIEEGTAVLVVLRIGPVRVLVPNRMVRVIDEPDLFGFAYGTLPGHAERGEESFVVHRVSDGRVTATIRVEATGAWLVTRLGGPVVRRLQRLALDRYLAALRRYVNTETDGGQP